MLGLTLKPGTAKLLWFGLTLTGMTKLSSTVVISLILVLLQGCYATRAYKNRKFELSSLDKFDAVVLPASDRPFMFSQGSSSLIAEGLGTYLDSNLAGSYTYAFLVVRNDSILYERYFEGVTPSTKLPSFSVAKSFVSTLVGMALEEGKISSLADPVTRYIPQLEKRDPRFSRITIQHLLDMRTGVKSSEGYTNPFSDVLKLGFTKNITPRTLKVKYGVEPGRDFDYKSVNTQLLAMVLEKATGKPVQDYMKEKLWLPLGMQFDASWNIDSKKRQKVRAFCCINAAALDYAKFGQLFANYGEWNGKQLISREWVSRSVSPDTMNRYDGYKNQWWSKYTRRFYKDSMQAASAAEKIPYRSRLVSMTAKDSTKYYQVMYRDAFHADGLLEQVVYVNPAKKLVIVRLGHYWKHKNFGSADGFVYNLGGMFQ